MEHVPSSAKGFHRAPGQMVPTIRARNGRGTVDDKMDVGHGKGIANPASGQVRYNGRRDGRGSIYAHVGREQGKRAWLFGYRGPALFLLFLR
ncbi:hypothetical protein KM043_014795 [Ampulex compressa]|nr:hypothetical protein KM043_014795 [Ampulex compressa]